MDEIFSIDGLDSHIYKFLTFKDLLLLRQVSKLNREVISTFSIMILKKFIHNFNTVTIDTDNINNIDNIDTIDTYNVYTDHKARISYCHLYHLYHYFREIEFMQNFVSDKRLYQSFITEIKGKKIDNYELKIYVKASNYYELMIFYKNDHMKLKALKPEETQTWTKVNGKWIIDKIIPAIKYPPLIERLVDNYQYLEIF